MPWSGWLINDPVNNHHQAGVQQLPLLQ